MGDQGLKNAKKPYERRSKASNYSIAIRYLYYDKNADTTYEHALKQAQQLMYEDKNRYYEKTGLDRRKV